jgi:hypothetical protein
MRLTTAVLVALAGCGGGKVSPPSNPIVDLGGTGVKAGTSGGNASGQSHGSDPAGAEGAAADAGADAIDGHGD